MTYKYKTNGEVEFVVPGFGVTVDGFITSETPIESPNLELVIAGQEAAPVQNPAATYTDGVAPQSAQPVPAPQVTPAAPAPESVVTYPQTPVQTAPAVESNGQI